MDESETEAPKAFFRSCMLNHEDDKTFSGPKSLEEIVRNTEVYWEEDMIKLKPKPKPKQYCNII